MRAFFEDLVASLREELFKIGETPISLATLFSVLSIVVATFAISSLTQRAIQRVLRLRGVSAEGTVGIVIRFLHYFFLVIGFGVALETVGIDLRTLFAAGAVFAVGLGLATQHIAQSFLGGVILMAERAIKPGDILEVEGAVVRVKLLGIRSTVVESRYGESLIVPNTVLVQSTVKNFTLRDAAFRLRIAVGVAYSSELPEVQKVLQRCADNFEGGLLSPPPRVLLSGFGASSVDFEVLVWTNDPWNEPQLRSQLLHQVWQALKEARITIAFPQLDLHLDALVLDALRGGSSPERLETPPRHTLPA